MSACPGPWEVVCGTGHRPQHLTPPQTVWLRRRVVDTVEFLAARCSTRIIGSGLALGFDTWWAEAALDRHLTVWGFAPCPQQADRWRRTDREHWNRLRERIVAAGGRVTFTADHYHDTVMDDRNQEMIAAADAVVAGYRPLKRSGGTFRAVRHAADRHLPGVHLDVDNYTHPRRHTRLLTDFATVLDTAGRVA